MSDVSQSPAPDPGSAQAAASLDVVQGTIEKFLSAATIDVVYGKPIKNGDALIIPTAEVLSGMGFGVAYGSGPTSSEQNQGSGGGGGGGGRVLSRPVAVVIASPEGVRVEPVLDLTKIGIAALTTAGFIFGMFMRMMRGPRQRK